MVTQNGKLQRILLGTAVISLALACAIGISASVALASPEHRAPEHHAREHRGREHHAREHLAFNKERRARCKKFSKKYREDACRKSAHRKIARKIARKTALRARHRTLHSAPVSRKPHRVLHRSRQKTAERRFGPRKKLTLAQRHRRERKAHRYVRARQVQRRDPAAVARAAHVKELLGHRYYKKIARTADKTRAVENYIHKLFLKSLPHRWKKDSHLLTLTIMAQARRYGFDPVFLVSVIQTESSFNTSAIGTSGEIGLMQLMPDTAQWIANDFHIRWGRKILYNPFWNIRIGAAYLSLLRQKFGADGRLYIPAYNMGPTALKRAVSDKVIPVDYARRVMSKYIRNYHVIQKQIWMQNHPELAIKHLKPSPTILAERAAARRHR